PVLQAGADENPAAVLHSKHELQLKRLEELVRDLSQLIARLESRFDDSEAAIGKLLSEAIGRFSVKESERNPSSSVRKYSSLWTERFHFVSAVKLKSSVTCINMLPFRDSDGGTAKYFAVGDENGGMHVFSRNGDVSLEFDTFADPHDASRITAMVSYPSVYKNETAIVTGHENGRIVKHRMWETPTAEDPFALRVDGVVAFEATTTRSGGNKKIDLLQVQNLGGRKRSIMAVNGDGDISVFEEDGKLYGTASPASRPVAFLKQRLLFLSETGAGSLDLRTMKITEGECEGLNGSSFVRSYVFDAVDRSKAYGFTSEGDLIQTILLGDSKNFKCRIRSKRKLDLHPPLALQTIKGYLLIMDAKNLILYNISSQNYIRGSGVKPMFSASVDEIASSFTNHYSPLGAAAVPLIATDGDKHVLVHVGGECVALFRSKLPGFRNGLNSILWTSPVLFFVAFLFGAWHFFANKKEALTSWGPDDLFSSDGTAPPPPPPPSSGGSDDSSRNAETTVVETRGGSGLRYISPQRY
ncbi:hypothetical protein M569_04852, partial [Genlisea aurea]